MRVLFADSFYFIALLNPEDAAHSKAAAFPLRGRTLMTTDWVLVEFADAFGPTRHREAAAALVRKLITGGKVEVAHASRSALVDGLELYAARPDKEWSLTDCISFVVRRERDLTEALTGDHHFEQAGFKSLLK